MPQPHQILTGKAFELHRAIIDQQFGAHALDVGVCEHLCNATGRDPLTIAQQIHISAHSIIAPPGGIGCNVGVIYGVKFFAFRRGNSIDVGTRKDFKSVGWEGMCDDADKDCQRFDYKQAAANRSG